MIEHRKIEEEEFHDRIREEKNEAANTKFYSITQKSTDLFNELTKKAGENKKLLDYCCGNGERAISLSNEGFNLTGIDISPISIEKAREKSLKIKFLIMDAENTSFKNNSFDIIYESGSLHHLNLAKAYKEIARILKPDGKVFCNEALRHNPFIHLYRKLTPNLRTPWEVEHILGKKEIDEAKKYFKNVEIIGFFHLFDLFAVPFRKTFLFDALLKILDKIDSKILRMPLIKWQAWQVIFVLSEPIKDD